jgi:ribosomal protein S18 acetylase RimI-like enzyme
MPTADRERVFSTLTAAFLADPVERWLYPGEADYLEHFPDFIAACSGDAFDQGTAWQLFDHGGVAVWLAPGSSADDEVVVKSLTSSVAPEKHADTLAVLEQMGSAHPTYPHWYLPWLGVSPDRHGHGVGAQLLTHGLTIVDESHLPAYLETPNPRTVSLYERHGFEVVGRAAAGACPPLTMMLRRAR